MLTGMFGAVVAVRDVRQVAPRARLGAGVWRGWEGAIGPARQTRMLRRRWSWQLPAASAARWQRDVPFWTLPDADRRLLCDLWQPPRGVAPSGLAVMYLHGSAWSLLDKDFGTRSVFRHLAAQGHVVMDVAYRLYPETDMLGVVGDAKRAIAWMKAQAPGYGVNPERIVVAGGSAGGYLALLAAYTPTEMRCDLSSVGRKRSACPGRNLLLRPGRRAGASTTTRVSISWGHLAQARRARPPSPLMRRVFGTAYQRLVLGKSARRSRGAVARGHAGNHPDRYALFSPTTHVRPDWGPDVWSAGRTSNVIAPLTATMLLFEKLVAAGVPAVNIVFPHAEHRVRPRFAALVTRSTGCAVLRRALSGDKCGDMPILIAG